MAFGEQQSGADPPDAVAATSDAPPTSGPGVDGSSAQLDATITLQSASTLHLVLPGDRDTLAGELQSDGRIGLSLAVPGGVNRLDGTAGFNGPLRLSIPLPGAGGTLEIPATLDGTAGLHMDAPGCVRLDIQGVITAPLVLRLPLADGLGELSLDAELDGDATLGMGLPGGQGQLQAHVRVAGTLALRIDLPHGHGRLTARGTISTPLTLSLVLPDGRAKFGVHDTVSVETTLRLRLPHGGGVEAASPIDTRLDGMLFLPSGRGELQATAPIMTRIHLDRLQLPQLGAPLSLDVRLEGAAELTTELPDRATRLRAFFTAALPLAPIVQLLQSEVERHVRVERMDIMTPHLHGAHDLALQLYVVVRRAVLAELQITAHLRIDPRSKQVELRSVHAEGLNAAGRAAAWLYINPRLLRSLRNTLLFDPFGTLPDGASIEALGFKAAARDELSVEGVVAWQYSL